MNQLKPREYSTLLRNAVTWDINCCLQHGCSTKIFYVLHEVVFESVFELENILAHHE